MEKPIAAPAKKGTLHAGKCFIVALIAIGFLCSFPSRRENPSSAGGLNGEATSVQQMVSNSTASVNSVNSRQEQQYQEALRKINGSNLEDQFDGLAMLLDLGDYKDAASRSEQLLEKFGGYAWIGRHYDVSLDVGDYGKAMEWYLRGADNGDSESMQCIGFMYDMGHGVAQDYKKAMEWYLKAAELGNEWAMYYIGRMYEYDGSGVPKDYKKAMEWFLKAAELGETYSMCEIGYMYEVGWGVTQNYETAMLWYQRAADLGRELGEVHMQSLSEKMRE